MSFDAGTLIAGFVVSSIGFVLFMYGKKMQRMPQLITGLVLMIYPYFVPGVWAMLGIGAVLLILLYVALARGT